MNETNNYMEKLFPMLLNGVEWKPLNSFLKIRNGSDYKTFGEGEYPVYGSGGIMTYVDRYVYDKPSVLIPRKGSIGNLFYVDEPFWNVDTIFYTEIDDTKAVPKYVYHCLKKEHLETLNTAGGVPSLTQSVLNPIEIPLPPLAVQEEIARILDTFTELETELEKELELRKKQYEYYRDKLLTFGDEVERKRLGELFNTKNGYTPSKSVPEYWDNGTVPWFRMEDIREQGRILNRSAQCVSELAVKGNLFPANSFIISTSATIGEYALIEVPSLANQRFTYLMLKEEFKNTFNIKFLFHYLDRLRSFCLQNLNQGNFASVDMQKFNSFEFPLPPLAEQERIALILDKFDALCNDLTQGIPAEIAMRRKQYDYYRDKLLTFRRKQG